MHLALPLASIMGWSGVAVGTATTIAQRVLIVATRLPQLLQLLQATHARGVSTASWALGSLNVALWLTYYASSSMSAAAVSMVVALAASVSILVLAVTRHRGRPVGSIVPRLHPGLGPA